MTEDFVQLAISSPEKTIGQLAEELAVSRRQLERITVIVSGLTPRKLARREQSKL
jgi:AraC-like DNA-binding protein